MSKYEDEAKKVVVLLLKGGHPEELKAMNFVMDEAALLGKQRNKLFNAILDGLKDHSCSCRVHWKLKETLNEIQTEINRGSK